MPRQRCSGTSDDADRAEALYRTHSAALWSYAMRRCMDPDDAADIVAATFLEAVANLDRFDPRRGREIAWLIGIAANHLRDLRRARRRQSQALSRLRGRDLLDPDERDLVEQRIDAMRRGAAIVERVRSLPTAEREVFLLVAIHDLSAAEAAQVVGIHPAAARMRLSRARRRLRAGAEGSFASQRSGGVLE